MNDPMVTSPRSRGALRHTAPGLLLIAAICSASCGIQSKGSGNPNYPARTQMHPLAPQEMEFHPLTRLVRREGEQPIIEAYLQFSDQWGHNIKALGELAVVLGYATADEASSAGLQQLMRWQLDLRSGEANAQRYDRVTRTYRIVLGAGAAIPPQARSLVLEATFITEDGRRLRAEFDLRDEK